MRILRNGPLRAHRPAPAALLRRVRAELEAVRQKGDRALRSGRPGRAVDSRVPPEAFERAFRRLGARPRGALEVACRHLGAVARRELAALKEFDLRPSSGLTVFHRRVPLGRIGMLVPAGRVSALLHAAIPAAVAGVPERVACVAPGPDGAVDDLVLAAAYMTDVTELHALGGAAAVGALAFGTASIPAVDRLLGSGDAAVRLARREVAGSCAVDLAEGPLELLVLADETAAVDLVAADLCAQAELDPEADCVLVTTSEAVARGVQAALRAERRRLPSVDPARGPLGRARAVVAADLEQAVALVNDYAPQRLSLQVVRPDDLVGSLRGVGAIYVGPQSPASLAEYAAGATALAGAGGAARRGGVLQLASLLPALVAVQVDPSAYPRLARAASVLAELEGRHHAQRALDIRLFAPETSG